MNRFLSAAFVIGATGAFYACGGAASTDLFETNGSDINADGGSQTDAGKNSDGSSQGDSGNNNNGNDSGGPTIDSGTDSGPMTTPCTVGKDGVQSGCGQDEACLSKDCMTGTCTPVMQSNAFVPVCGCDNVNYWNASVASGFVAGVRASGVCATPATCTGGAGSGMCGPLPQGGDCAYERADANLTCGADKTPVCWGLPGNCPTTTTGVTPCLAVSGNNCSTLCDAIKNQTPYRATACTVK